MVLHFFFNKILAKYSKKNAPNFTIEPPSPRNEILDTQLTGQNTCVLESINATTTRESH